MTPSPSRSSTDAGKTLLLVQRWLPCGGLKSILTMPNSNTPIETLSLKRLFMLRSTAIVIELIAITVAIVLLGMALPLLALLATVTLHAVINVVTWLRLQRQPIVSAPEFAFQLALDTLVLAMLLYFSGGYTNPFVSLLLLPLVITAAILPQRYAWLIAALTISSYTTLMFTYQPLSHRHMPHQSGNDFDMHLLGMWFSFLLSAALIVFFVVKIANSLRQRDLALAKIREKALRDEHLIELGTLATGAAHELGTPLATMAVLTNELCHDHRDDPEIREQAEILRQQVERCKAILSNISASTGQARAEGGGRVAVDIYLKRVLQQWQQLRGGVQPQHHFKGPHPAPQLLADKTLTQAIINILNNAADASAQSVEMDGRWSHTQLLLTIRDRGRGQAREIEEATTTPFITTKREGHGLGLYLAKSVVERYNGSLEINNRTGGGIEVCITLPLTHIETAP